MRRLLWRKPKADEPKPELRYNSQIMALKLEVGDLRSEIEILRGENELLRSALEPFAANVNAWSLSRAMGHISREHLFAARKALDHKP